MQASKQTQTVQRDWQKYTIWKKLCRKANFVWFDKNSRRRRLHSLLIKKQKITVHILNYSNLLVYLFSLLKIFFVRKKVEEEEEKGTRTRTPTNIQLFFAVLTLLFNTISLIRFCSFGQITHVGLSSKITAVVFLVESQ